jgi:HrpA-like RNA helicase
MADFPISRHLPELRELVSSNQALQIIAPTGTGKSIAIPRYLAQMGYRVLVATPTIASALSLWSYQKELAGISVGYAADREIRYDDQSQIIYATSGHVYRLLLRKQYPCTLLFVDEVHTGLADITLIISLYLHHYENKIDVPKILLVSATPVPLQISPRVWAPDFGSPYRVTVEYEDVDIPSQSLMVAAANKVHSIVDPGDVLVFAPGKREIQQIISALNTRKNDYEIYSLHREVDREYRDKIFRKSDRRKVIVATNVAETSLTIPGIVYVVDTLLEKISETSPAQAERLVTTKVSKDSADQRKGRTGRTSDGFCFRLISKESYDKLPQHRLAEIYRIPLNQIIIELLSSGYDPEEVLNGLHLSAQISTALSKLSSLGLIIGSHVNDSGHFAARINLSVNNAALVYKWITQPHVSNSPTLSPAAGVLVGCLLESGILEGPEWAGVDDLATTAAVWRESRKIPRSNILRWTQEHNVDHRALKELEKKVERVAAFSRLAVPESLTEEELDQARNDIRKVYKRVVYLVSGLQYRDRINGSEVNFTVDSRAVNNYREDPPQALLVCQLVDIGGRYRIPFSIRIKYNELGEEVKSPYLLGNVSTEVSSSGLVRLANLNKILSKSKNFVQVPPNVYGPFGSNHGATPSADLLRYLSI